jgi:hypothetical protein
MDEWTQSVRDRPKAYSVTLAPYAIALGPAPPNVLEFEHQRDVLIRCGKLRSQTLDKINLVDYILDPNHMGEFAMVPPPEGPDLAALQAALAGNLDVIADAAASRNTRAAPWSRRHLRRRLACSQSPTGGRWARSTTWEAR